MNRSTSLIGRSSLVPSLKRITKFTFASGSGSFAGDVSPAACRSSVLVGEALALDSAALSAGGVRPGGVRPLVRLRVGVPAGARSIFSGMFSLTTTSSFFAGASTGFFGTSSSSVRAVTSDLSSVLCSTSPRSSTVPNTVSPSVRRRRRLWNDLNDRTDRIYPNTAFISRSDCWKRRLRAGL